MSGVNKVILVGNVGKEPDIRYTTDGNAVANFSIATSETWKDKATGQRQEKTEWHRCVAFRKTAELISEYVKQGSKVYVEGKLQTRKWEKDGCTHYTTEINVGQIQFLDARGESSQPKEKNIPGVPQFGTSGSFDDDEIPF